MIRSTINPMFLSLLKSILLLILLASNTVMADDIASKIKSYISDIEAITVEFIQQDKKNNITATGMLIIDKPYKFRCNYYEPFPLLIVGGKNYVSVYDYEMEQLNRIKASENVFNFLLMDNVDFETQFTILASFEENGRYILKLLHNELDKISEIVFDKAKNEFRELRIYEHNNVITLQFSETRRIYDVERSLFILQDPALFGKSKRLNKQDLEKKFKIK